MRINYFSDVHLEFGSCPFPVQETDLVIAAGDIAPGLNGLPWLSQSPAPVVYIAGNHEYYGMDMWLTQATFRQAKEKYPNIHFLEKDIYEDKKHGVRVLGTTLWSDFNRADPKVLLKMGKLMNDFTYISVGGRRITPVDLLQIHVSSLEWLTERLNESYDGKTVVVTHHAPSLLSWHKPEMTDERRYGYCSNLESLIETANVDLWIHGHTHAKHLYYIGKTRVACKARGYLNIDKEGEEFSAASIYI